MGASCEKHPLNNAEFYFRCKLNGQLYLPNNCANCMQCDLLGDTTLILGGNRDFESLGMGIKDNSGIKPITYVLNQNVSQRGSFKNGTLTTDRYFTDSARTGVLKVNSIDKTNKIIEGSFYFKAYNSLRDDSVNITEGSFRLKYNTN